MMLLMPAIRPLNQSNKYALQPINAPPSNAETGVKFSKIATREHLKSRYFTVVWPGLQPDFRYMSAELSS